MPKVKNYVGLRGVPRRSILYNDLSAFFEALERIPYNELETLGDRDDLTGNNVVNGEIRMTYTDDNASSVVDIVNAIDFKRTYEYTNPKGEGCVKIVFFVPEELHDKIIEIPKEAVCAVSGQTGAKNTRSVSTVKFSITLTEKTKPIADKYWPVK